MSTKRSTKLMVNKITSPKKVLKNSETSVNNITKNKGGQPSKKSKYPKERQEVLDKLFAILQVTENNMSFNLTELEKDNTRQKQILDLVDDIKKYFNCSKWNYFANENVNTPFISITRSLLKEMGYKLEYYRVLDKSTKRVGTKKMDIVKI